MRCEDYLGRPNVIRYEARGTKSEIGGVIMEVEIGALCFEDARRDPQPRSASRNWTD